MKCPITYALFLIMVLALLSACAPGAVNTTVKQGQGQHAGGTFAEYDLPQPRSGLMRPVVDLQGHIWFGEMGHNALAMFDPQTHQFQQFTPPGGDSGIMGIQTAPDNTIWFAEQNANYIGHYTPTTQHFQNYSLPTVAIPDPDHANSTLTLPSAPNDLALDAQGNVWFTEMNSDQVGMLNPQTGQIKQYQLGDTPSVQKLSPYGIAIDHQGNVWFTEATSNMLGKIDPAGKIQRFTYQGASSPLMEIASDDQGNIWGTTFLFPHLVKFAIQQETFTLYTPSNTPGGSYGLALARNHQIWMTLTEQNQLARFDTTTNHFAYYQVPTEGSSPFGIAIDAHGTLWVTETVGNKLLQYSQNGS
jgi:virginiamycin B lyase